MELAISIFAILSSLAQVVAVFYLVKQLKAMQQSNFSVTFKTVYDILQSDEIRTARRYVIKELSNKSFEEWDKKNDKSIASQVCQSY